MAIHKVIEIMGESNKGWEDAAQNAVKEAAKTVKNIKSVWVKDQNAKVDKKGKLTSYRVTTKITFQVR